MGSFRSEFLIAIKIPFCNANRRTAIGLKTTKEFLVLTTIPSGDCV
jgi:hypothetical protein